MSRRFRTARLPKQAVVGRELSGYYFASGARVSVVFVSYDRESIALSDQLVADIRLLGHRVSEIGGPGQSRTADLEFRKLLLYPSELRGLAFCLQITTKHPETLVFLPKQAV